MDNLTTNIYREISARKNVLLVGPTDSGKTWYIKNILVPFLHEKKIKVIYFPNLDFFQGPADSTDVFIVDEVETLIDQDFLETHSNNPEQYYPKNYLAKVKVWHDRLRKLTAPSIFILTRNNQGEIDNIVNKLMVTDWGAKVKCFAFKKQTEDRPL